MQLHIVSVRSIVAVFSFAFLGVAHAADCISLAGTYNATEAGSISCTLDGDTDTLTISGSAVVVIDQQGCNIAYDVPGTNITRHGTISGNGVMFTGPFVVFQPGVVSTQNTVTVSGTVTNPAAFALNGSGAASGTVQGEHFSCSGTSRATFNRLSAPAVGQLQLPSTIAFGSVALGGTSAATSAVLTNVGTATINVSSVGNSNASEFTATNNTCASVPAGGSCALTFVFRPSAVGTRTATITVTSNGTGSPQTFVVSGTGIPAAALNFQGMWWNAPAGAESGWGINFAHQGDVVFATWFTHDLNGKAWNLSMTAFQTGSNTFSGTLNLTSGPPLGSVPFDPARVQRIAVGAGTLTFSDGNNGTFAYTVNGISQTKAITRQVFGTLPTCVWGGLSDLTLATNYTDMWWAAGGVESGWGINFTQQVTQQGDIIFATWFTYDSTGAALPMSATLTKIGTNVWSGTLIRTSGPPFNAVPFNPDAVTRTTVGAATVTFTNGNAATFSYQVNDGTKSVTQTKSITRQVFRAPGTVCR